MSLFTAPLAHADTPQPKESSMLDRIKSWCRHSATIAWAYALAAAGAALEIFPPALDLIGAPDVAEAIKAMLPAQWVGLYTVVIGIVTYAARMRSLRG
jgi:hypothetical protein